MIRDLLNHRIKKGIPRKFIQYLEKYYIYHNNIYQIIRVKPTTGVKMGGGFEIVEFKIRNTITNKIKNISLNYQDFLDRTYYKSIVKAINDFKHEYNQELDYKFFNNNNVTLTKLYENGFILRVNRNINSDLYYTRNGFILPIKNIDTFNTSIYEKI